jgi:hypothetical protein
VTARHRLGASVIDVVTTAGMVLARHRIGREPLITLGTFGELTKWAEIRHL